MTGNRCFLIMIKKSTVWYKIQRIFICQTKKGAWFNKQNTFKRPKLNSLGALTSEKKYFCQGTFVYY